MLTELRGLHPITAVQSRRITAAFDDLLRCWGRQNWWPADSPFEVAVGAVLVQNTAWRNAELAVANLRASGLLHSKLLAQSATEKVEMLIRPAGFQRQKAQTLLRLARYVTNGAASFEEFLAQPTALVREQLLALRGIGPETADSILLYAAGHEIFVVDVYLRRFLLALGYESMSELEYEHLRLEMEMLVAARREAFGQILAGLHSQTPSHPATSMSGRPRTPLADIYNELHAVLVRDGVQKRVQGKRATLQRRRIAPK